MTPQRLQMETSILERYFPRRYKFENLNTNDAYLDLGVKVQSGTVYRLNIKINSDYPNSLPKIYIVYPIPLLKSNGDKIEGYSHNFHTLENDGEKIQICHYKKEKWNPNLSFYQLALKARIWLEAYEGHKRTGKPIDDFLIS